MQFTPHTDDDLAMMLDTVLAWRRREGMPAEGEGIEALFAHIPDSVRLKRRLDLPVGRSEDEVLRDLGELASRNRTDLVCFAGGGAYDHYVPSVVGALLSRGEFLTAYTPYQPEVSQGMLQALFEYQTVVAELTGLPAANASLYDGGSAVAEAVSMTAAATGRDGVLVSAALDAPSRAIVRTYGHPQGRVVSDVAYTPSGHTPIPDIPADVGTMVVAQPNALGVVEDIRAHAAAAHAAGAMLVVKLEPTAVGLLATPGSQGADVVIGDGQPLGQGLQFGGPTVGFLACAVEQVRRIPGRIVGETVDRDGTRGYVMTLRAREQDIRREKATSNICTNQTLNALAALVYLTWLGPDGLRDLALACLSRARHAAARLAEIDGVEVAVSGPFLKEFPIRLGGADPHVVVERLADAGYLVGPVVENGAAARSVMVAVTERRTRHDVEGLAAALERTLKEVA